MDRNINNNNNQIQHSYLVLNTNNVSTWGGYSNIDVTLQGYVIHEATLQINVSAISGLVASGLFPCFCSAFKFFVSCTVTNNNNVLDLFDSQSNYLINQLYNNYEDAVFINNASGAYNSASSRFAMSSTTSTYLVPIKVGIFNQLRTELLNSNHSIRLSFLMENLTNIINQSTISGTPSATLNSVSLLLKISKYEQPIIQSKLLQLQRNPLCRLYNSYAYQPATVNSGASSSIINLSNFSGLNIQFIYFVIRLSSTLTKSEGFLFLNNLTNYSFLSSSGEILSGQAITPQQALYVYNKSNTLGCFSAVDTTYGNVFSIFHTSDAISTMSQPGAGVYGHRSYNGSESLVLNFSSVLTANITVDIYASVTSMLKQTNIGITKIIV